MPSIENNKFVTLNNYSYMKLKPDIFSQKFIDYKTKLPMLEIGTAYGYTTRAALLNGATIIANDLDHRHLAILYQQTPKELLNHLYLKPGAFPEEVNFPTGSLGAVLMCRVAHFFSPEQLVSGLNKISNWLIPGGKLFFVSITPTHRLLNDEFMPIYKQRLEMGEKWPGIINNMKELNPLEAENFPDFFNVFDEYIIKNLLPEFGFSIEEMQLFDNNGYLGFVAEKNC